MTAIDRVLLNLAPGWALTRMRAKAVAETLMRHYEAAQGGRRTENWRRASTDVNAANGPAIHLLRVHARDLVRNNPWAKRGKQVLGNNVIGWGIVPKPMGAGKRALKRARELWRGWAETTQCDYNNQRNFYGLERLAFDTVVESGEVIVRRWRRKLSDGLTIPLQLQVLEPDYIDTTRDGLKTDTGGRIVQGVEFDTRGRRVAYWLFTEHPGSTMRMFSHIMPNSERVPAEDIRHMYRIDRPGQVRGISSYASVIVKLKDFDEFEDATLLRQKIAACFAAFVTDVDGTALPIGTKDVSRPDIETIEPGMVYRVPLGKSVTFASPPTVTDQSFSDNQLHAIASGLGVTFEDLSGKYDGVNFSSARMSRLAHYANVHDWRWNVVIPMFCTSGWEWAMEQAFIAGLINEQPGAEWTPPPMPMIEPDKEGLAYMRLVRTGGMTFDEMIRELGGDPDLHWEEYAEQLKRLDDLGIVLDSDPRRTTQAGNPVVPQKASKDPKKPGPSGT